VLLLFLIGCKGEETTNNVGKPVYFSDSLIRLHDTLSLCQHMKFNGLKVLFIIEGNCDCVIEKLQEMNVFLESNEMSHFKNCVVVNGSNIQAFDNLMLKRNMYKNIAFFRDTHETFFRLNSIDKSDFYMFILDSNNLIIEEWSSFSQSNQLSAKQLPK